jgi:hypothetical protein
MSMLFDLRDKLQDTEALIARLERELPNYADPSPLILNLRTLEARRGDLANQFLQVANESGLEVCNYRVLPILGKALVAGIGNALVNYQAMFSLFVDAATNGPKQTSKIGAELVTKTSLELEYAYAGSIGFVMTVPRDVWLLEESFFEEAVRLIVEVAHAKKPDEIRPYATKLGLAPIRAVFRWAESHVKASFGAEILWRRGDAMQSSLLVQTAEFDQLQKIIGAMSDEKVSTIEAAGKLVGADVKARTFHFVPDQGAEIRGAFTDAIDDVHPVELPKRYIATVQRTTRIAYSTEDEQIAYHLVKLHAL